MYYYKINKKYLISKNEYKNLSQNIISEDEVKNSNGQIYVLNKLNPLKSRRSYAVTDSSLLFIEEEGLHLINKNDKRNYNANKPEWLVEKINSGLVTSINTEYPTWQDVLNKECPAKWTVNVVGLGDVGGTLVTGLRLLGADCINKIGLFDKGEDKIQRWTYEVGQILSPSMEESNIEICPLNEDELFNCDMFVFCVSVGVPKIGDEKKDVRMVQFEGNSKIVNYYAHAARKAGFKGIFAVVSDPVDLLCKSAFLESNKDEHGDFDFKGLAPEQIKGYGLGVMNARAAFYAKQDPKTSIYLKEGRAFGPHGEGLIIANSIENYNEEDSNFLTEKSRKANLDVRAAGFKPYIAPALSSGSLSLIATMKGEWHYSCNFTGGTFMGSRNRILKSGIELETYNLHERLYEKLQNTYNYLNNII